MPHLGINAPAHATAVELPLFINSASERGEIPRVFDWVLVLVCLMIPMIVWAVLRTSEGMNAGGERALEARLGRRPRIGLLYLLQEKTVGSMTPASLLMQTFQVDSAEGSRYRDVVAGFATALAMIPSVVSFSFITETSPANGLWACAFMSISTSMVGGRPGMVSGVSFTTAVVLANISTTDGMGGTGPMALCVFGAGLMQLFLGLLHASRLMVLIPHPVMLGFINGLAALLLHSQLRHFHDHGDGPLVGQSTRVGMVATAGVGLCVALLWKRSASCGEVVPATLASILIASTLAICLTTIVPCRTLGDIVGPGVLQAGFHQVPRWDFPPAGMEWGNHRLVLRLIFTSMRLALVGLLESLTAEALIDQITGTSGSMRRECFGQGFGNILASLFGTQGGCGLLGHSLLNVSSGGRSRLSGLVAGFTCILCAMVLSPLIASIPVAAVMGVMVLLALSMFAWGTFRMILRINLIDSVVMIAVMAITFYYDVAAAVLLGVIIYALGFAWRTATEARVETLAGPSPDERTFFLTGPLFFASAANYQKEMNPLMVTETTVVLDFSKCRILDISGVDAINKTRDALLSHGKRVIIKGIPQRMVQFLPKDALCDMPPPLREDLSC